MIKTYKVMLVPNKKQETKLFAYAGAARFAYNWALEKQMEAFRNGEVYSMQTDFIRVQKHVSAVGISKRI